MATIAKDNKPFSVDTLDVLLQQRRDHSLAETITMTPLQDVLPRQQSTKSATLHDFIDMVANIITKATRERPVYFELNEGVRPRVDQSIPLNQPWIFYEVISRRPCLELKPRERQELLETDIAGRRRQGRVWGQRFECIVQFNIIAGSYNDANKVMDLFEDVMFNYTSYFKKNGVSEILFDEQSTDHNFDLYRQAMAVKNLRYRVWIEKLHTAFDTTEIDGVISG